MRQKIQKKIKSNAKRIGLKGALLFTLLFTLLFSKTKNCMHNKCMGLYGNLANGFDVNDTVSPTLVASGQFSSERYKEETKLTRDQDD